MNKDFRFVVILARPDGRDLVALAKALAAARKTLVYDQMMTAKNAWGIVAENLTEPEAKALVQALRSSGVESVVCPSASLLPLPSAEPAATLQALPASPPVLIAVAGITSTNTVKERPSGALKILNIANLLAGAGLPIRIGGKERVVEKTQQHSEIVFYADILYKAPPRRLRIDARRFDYSFLKERKLYQTRGNFKLLIGDLVKGSPEAWKNHGTQILLEGKHIHTMGYQSLADMERETRWMLTLQSLKN